MNMRKIIAAALILLMAMPCRVSAFNITRINPDSTVIDNRDIKQEEDIKYLKSIANIYSDRFFVEQAKYADISAIDEFYKALSEPMTLEEIDKGVVNISFDNIFSSKLRNSLKNFKVLGGLAGYTAEFEPVAYFNIYRNISLVGGYNCYSKSFDNPADACREYIANVEFMSKEIIPYKTRVLLEEKIKEMDNFVNNDNTFKIFLLTDGKINSVWERDGI